MAAPGVFPKVVGDSISRLDYNAIQTLAYGVKTTFLGEACVSAPVTLGATISHTDWNNLKTDIDYCISYLGLSVTAISTKNQGDIIYKDDVNLYYTNAYTADVNKAWNINLVINSDAVNYTLSQQLAAAGYTGVRVGKSKIALTVLAGFTVTSGYNTIPALTLDGLTTGDSLNVINNGTIIGAGGNGGYGAPQFQLAGAGTAGGPAISLGGSGTPTIAITNNNVVAGGGGGGGGGGYLGITTTNSKGQSSTTWYGGGGGGGGAGVENALTVRICGTIGENGTLALTAPTGYTFTSVDFASYGTPNGSCGAFTLGGCDAPTSVAIVQNYLLGKTGTVYIPATNGVFTDPCNGTVKRLYVQAVASLTASNASIGGRGGVGQVSGTAGHTGTNTAGGAGGSYGGGKAGGPGAAGAAGSAGTGAGAAGGAAGNYLVRNAHAYTWSGNAGLGGLV